MSKYARELAPNLIMGIALGPCTMDQKLIQGRKGNEATLWCPRSDPIPGATTRTGKDMF